MLVIVAVSSEEDRRFFEGRLPPMLPVGAQLVVLVEPWPAGNGLGTLWAWQQAGRSLEGEPAVLYAAPGAGSRLEPLSSIEGGCKARVSLPGSGGITLLEAVIRNTLPLVQARAGRLTVCWVDQLFSSSHPSPPAKHPIEILAKVTTVPSTWDLESYGVLALEPTRPLEKVDQATWHRLFPYATHLGISLGNFTLTEEVLEELITRFTPELEAKTATLNVEKSFWMAITHDRPTYLSLGGDPTHWDRLRDFRPSIGVIDIGEEGSWWDFGQFASYLRWCQLHERELEGDVVIEGSALVYKGARVADWSDSQSPTR